MSYGIGEDIPLILQGAAQREAGAKMSTPVALKELLLPIAIAIGAALVLSNGSRGRNLWILAILFAGPVVAQRHSLNDPPVMLTSAFLTVTASSIPDSSYNGFVGESLRVVMGWKQPTDGGGNADSTLFNFKSTKAGVFARGATVVVANIAVRRKSSGVAILADTFKLLKPPVNDSVLFNVNGLIQCRKGKCSVPGSAAWGYFRTVAPPAVTFIRVTVDSF